MDSIGLKKFLTSLKDTDIEELKLEAGNTKISFKRSNSSIKDKASSMISLKKSAQSILEETQKKFVPIKSPMVGTFYSSDSSDRPPFVIEGNHILPGQKIGIIETMKILKNVTSSVKGRIVKVLVANAQAVEYGQDLFLVDTEE